MINFSNINELSPVSNYEFFLIVAIVFTVLVLIKALTE